MAFVNEKMTPEEIKIIEDMKIKTHGPGVYTIRPSQWTIDREKNVFLVSAGYNQENAYERYYIFFWKNIPIKIKLFQCIVRDKPNTLRWEIRREEEKSGNSEYIQIPIELGRNKKGEIDRTISKEISREIVNSVKEAFKVYGVFGDYSERSKTKKEKTNIEFDF